MDTSCVNGQPVSVEVIQFTKTLASRVQKLREVAESKLITVMNCETPTCLPNARIEPPMVAYPPLFHELRISLLAIEDAVRSIEEYLSRVEL